MTVINDAVREQRVDFLLAIAERLHGLAGMLAEPGRRPADGGQFARGLDGQAERFHAPDDRMVVLDDHLARLDVRVVEDLLVAVDRAARNPRRVELLDPVRGRPRREDRFDFAFQLVDILQARWEIDEARIGSELRLWSSMKSLVYVAPVLPPPP